MIGYGQVNGRKSKTAQPELTPPPQPKGGDIVKPRHGVTYYTVEEVQGGYMLISRDYRQEGIWRHSTKYVSSSANMWQVVEPLHVNVGDKVMRIIGNGHTVYTVEEIHGERMILAGKKCETINTVRDATVWRIA